MMSHKSVKGVCKLINWMLMHSNRDRVKSRITLPWAGLKVLNGSKNLAIVHGRVRDDTKGGWAKNKKAMHRHQVSPTGVLLLVFLTCSKAAKQFLTCSNSAKQLLSFLTGSKLAK